MNGPFFLPIWMWEWGGWRGGVVGRTGGGGRGEKLGGGGIKLPSYSIRDT